MQSVDITIKNRILGSGRSWVFTPTIFLDLGSRAAVDKVLSRLAARGTIRRLARGLYDYPRKHPKLGLMHPAPEAVAKTLARRDSVRIQASGAYAANLLGLSDQVPAKVTFLTNGPSRKVMIGNMEITLRRTTSRNVATTGRLSGLIIQALRHIGRPHVTPEHIAHLRRRLPANERAKLLRDLRYAPTWMHAIFRELAEGEDQ